MASYAVDYERSIISALSVSDPSMDTSLGSPIRKIISAVAVQLADYRVDANTTNTLYAIDAVSGAELDYLVGQFGFTRQEATVARGVIHIHRDNSDSVMSIPYGTQVIKPATASSPAIVFQTTAYQELAEGIKNADIAIVATVEGKAGNVPAQTITYSTPYGGYIEISNPEPTTGGRDAETDADLRTRFLNTVFRNESGTRDQLSGLAFAHKDVSRVNVIGQDSRYSEIVQVQNDSTAHKLYVTPSSDAYQIDVASVIDLDDRLWLRRSDDGSLINSGQYNADSSVPFRAYFSGDTVEESFAPISGAATIALTKLPVEYNSVERIEANTGGITTVLTPTTDYAVDYDSNDVTFTSHAALSDSIVTVKYRQVPVSVGDFVTIEFDYSSKHNRGGLKTVDVYTDAESPQKVNDVQYLDFDKKIANTASSQYYKGKWVRKDGSLPSVGHPILLLSHQPLISSVGSINVGTSMILTEDTHFFILRDVTGTAGSVYGIDAIELNGTISNNLFTFTGTSISLSDNTPMNVPYNYNSDIEAIQEVISAQSVITMDNLVHAAKKRRFEFNLAVIYSSRPTGNVRNAIESTLSAWVGSLPFGHTVQFSDIETVVANVSGVDNVRVATSSDGAVYGLVEYEEDGTLVSGGTKTSDFRLAQNEILSLFRLNIIDKTQQNW